MIPYESRPEDQPEAVRPYSEFIDFVKNHIGYEFSPDEGEAKAVYAAENPVYSPMPIEKIQFAIINTFDKAREDADWGMYSIALEGGGVTLYELRVDREYDGSMQAFASANLERGGDDIGRQDAAVVAGFQTGVSMLLAGGSFVRVADSVESV